MYRCTKQVRVRKTWVHAVYCKYYNKYELVNSVI